jgi:fibronectin type 3 domain-containing protein
VTPYFMQNIGTATARFPSFMALDITALAATYAAGTTSFYLTLGSTSLAGVISSFKVQQYANGYSSGATKVSGQSPNVPKANPCSVTVSLTASSSSTTVPGAPTGVSATAGSGSIAMAWTAPASTGGSAITSYSIYRGTSTGQETLLGTASSTARSYTDTAVVSGTTYYYQVAAVNAMGTSSRSAEASAKVPTVLTVPGAPTGLTASASGSSASLRWTAPASTGGSAITSYSIYRGTGAGSESTTAIGTSTTTTYTDATVVAGKTYYYVVKAINSVGVSPVSNEVSYVISSVPSAPTNLAATQSSGKVALTWTAPASSGSSPVTSYSVFRGVSSALTDQVSIASTSTTSYTDALSTAGTYYYTVKAVSAVGTSVASTSISVVIKSATTIPGIPTATTAVGTNGAIIISWSAPANNGGSAITGYKVYQSTVSGSETLLVTLGTTTSYTNSGLTNGKTYYYRISALNALGEGSLGPEVSAVPNQPLVVPGSFSLSASVSSGVVMLSWNLPSSTSPLQYFEVMRSVSGTETMIAKLSPTRLGIVDTTTLAGKDYTYRIVAYNLAGSTSSPSVTVHAIGTGVGQNTLNLGSLSPELMVGQLGLLVVILIGTIGSVLYIRSRNKND